MTNFIFANDVNTSLAGAISSSSTTLTLSSTLGLPSSIPSGSVLAITLRDQATRQITEIIYASSISGATLSGLLRAQEGTTALNWSIGDYAYCGPTAGQMASFANINGSSSEPFSVSSLTASEGVFNNIQVLTSSSGNFTVPAGVTKLYYIVTGDGGAGGGCQASNNTQTFGGAGGGSGGTAIGIAIVTPGQIIPYTIGQGGVALLGTGNAGSGSGSSFGTIASATGGQGARYNSAISQAGGIGGIGQNGVINISGGDGSDGQSSSYLFSGNGGASFWGGGGRSGSQGGQIGPAWGSGGGGAYDVNFSGSKFAGANGAPGVIILRW